MPKPDPDYQSLVEDHRQVLRRHVVALVRDIDGRFPCATSPWLRHAIAAHVLGDVLDEAATFAAKPRTPAIH